MADITVMESIRKRGELSKAIAALLAKFSAETGFVVDSIYVDSSMNYNGMVDNYRVDVEVKLP